jgi:replicative DNA helicase
MLLSETALYSTIDNLRADDFYLEPHRLIYASIISLVQEGGAVDMLTVKAKMDSKDTLSKAGGVTKLSALIDSLPDTANHQHYAEVIKDHSTRRRLVALGREVAAAAVTEESGKDALDLAMFKLTGLAEAASSGEILHVGDYAERVIEELEEMTAGNLANVGVKTGLHNLDQKVLMRNGRTIVVAGATSTGKSSLALQIADQVARAGQKVAFFSLEMSGEELATRVLAAHTGLDQRAIESGPATPKSIADLKAELSNIKGSYLYIDDNPGCTPLDVRARSRQIQMRHGLDLIIVDYLQLLSPGGYSHGRSREQEVAAMSRQLKIAARALSVPLILLSQLSRKHLDENRPPELRDLRESGAIENDADIVMMVWRPDLELAQSELLVRKQRQGALGSIPMTFDGKSTRFSEEGGVGMYYDECAPVSDGEEGDEDSIDF